MQNRALIAAECRQLADSYKARAREPGVSQRRAALLTNIARNFTALAGQLEMLSTYMAEESRK
jgi:hypothetical protein